MRAPALTARKLTAQSAAKMFRRYFDACGADECRAAFGWDRPRVVHPNEMIFEYSVDAMPDVPEPRSDKFRAVVGFGLVEYDPRDYNDTEAMFVLGVFPEHRRRGYFTHIVDDLASRSRELGADTLSQIVFKDNDVHYKRVMKMAELGPWIYAGDVWYPAPGYAYFVLPLEGTPDNVTEQEEDRP